VPRERSGGDWNRVVDDHDTALGLVFVVLVVLLRRAARLGDRQLRAGAVAVTLLFASPDLLDDERVEHEPPPGSHRSYVTFDANPAPSVPPTSQLPSLLGPDRPLSPDIKNFREGQLTNP